MTLIDASLQFPTAVFTVGLGIALVYWVIVLLGALDLDLFGDTDGGDAGADGDGGIWHGLGLGGVPLMISASVILLLGWAGSLLVMQYVLPELESSGWIPPLLLPVMLVVAMLVTGVLVRPLRPLFAVKQGKSNRDYIGHLCTINTGSVDATFGQATVEDGGTVLVIPVRCDIPGKFARNDKALIIDYDPERQAYVVEPTADMLPASGDGAGAGAGAGAGDTK